MFNVVPEVSETVFNSFPSPFLVSSQSFKIYLFLAALGLRRCAPAFSSFGEWGLLFVVVRGLLIAVASLAAEHGF